MPPVFVFIRHSHRLGEALSDHGRASVQHTAQWLTAQRYLPDLVLTTDTLRTRETATLLMRQTGRTMARLLAQRSLFGTLDGLRSHTREGAARQPTGVVWFVGHHPSEACLQRVLGAALAIPPDNRCAAVAFERDGDDFRMLAWFAGSA